MVLEPGGKVIYMTANFRIKIFFHDRRKFQGIELLCTPVFFIYRFCSFVGFIQFCRRSFVQFCRPSSKNFSISRVIPWLYKKGGDI